MPMYALDQTGKYTGENYSETEKDPDGSIAGHGMVSEKKLHGYKAMMGYKKRLD